MNDCIFCKIIKGDLPSKTIYEDDLIKVIIDTLYPLLKDKLGCEGLTISQNNLLGQTVPHFHIHVTPRYEGDLLEFEYNKEAIEDLDTIFEKLQ